MEAVHLLEEPEVVGGPLSLWVAREVAAGAERPPLPPYQDAADGGILLSEGQGMDELVAHAAGTGGDGVQRAGTVEDDLGHGTVALEDDLVEVHVDRVTRADTDVKLVGTLRDIRGVGAPRERHRQVALLSLNRGSVGRSAGHVPLKRARNSAFWT
jgi:hypothetical protein